MEAPEPSTLGSAASWIAGTLSAGWAAWAIMRKQNSAQNVTEASNEANIEAINTYKALVAELRADKAIINERADKFAEERNEAWKQLYATQGKLEAMAEQIMALRQEVQQLRADQLKATS